MRAIHVAAPRKIEFIDPPIPQPKEGEVLVKCSHVALCGSNMGQYTGVGIWADLNFPNPAGWAGHENVGTIVESRCPQWKEGTLVLAQPEGYYGFAEYIVARPPGIAWLPQDARDPAALIVAQPLSTVLRAMTQTENVVNLRCGVIGAGPMGLVWTHVLHHFGAAEVITVDLLDWRLEWAKRFGARHVIDASKQDVIQTVKDLTKGQKLDFVATAASSVESLAVTPYLIKRGGRVFAFGMPDHNDQKFPWYAAFRNETRIITTVGPECSAFFQTAADMVVDGRANDLGAMVTPRMPWDQAVEAFEMYAECAKGSLKLTLEL